MAKRVVRGARTRPEKIEASRAFRRRPTPAERTLWQALRRNMLGGLHFRRQQIIDGFFADFYCHSAGLVAEVDGSVHDDQQEYDANRTLVIAGRSINVLRVTNQEVLSNINRTLIRIYAAALDDDSLLNDLVSSRLTTCLQPTNFALDPFPPREGTALPKAKQG